MSFNFALNKSKKQSLEEVFSKNRKVGVLKNFAKFTGKHPCQSLLIKLQAEVCNFIKKETAAQVFSCEFCEHFKNTFLTEHLWITASEVLKGRAPANKSTLSLTHLIVWSVLVNVLESLYCKG